MPRNPPHVPTLRLHKASGRAYVRIDGRFHHLGVHGTPQSKAAYKRFVAEYLANHRVLRPANLAAVTVAEVMAAFWTWCKSYYVYPDGKPTSQADEVR